MLKVFILKLIISSIITISFLLIEKNTKLSALIHQYFQLHIAIDLSLLSKKILFFSEMKKMRIEAPLTQ